MNNGNKQLSLVERWELDIESYKKGVQVLTSTTQCETCTHLIKGNALHCQKYENEKKPKYVMFPKKECCFYNNNNPIIVTITNNIENKLYGGLFGFCIGDILGVPVEFSLIEEKRIQ